MENSEKIFPGNFPWHFRAVMATKDEEDEEGKVKDDQNEAEATKDDEGKLKDDKNEADNKRKARGPG